mmetsp:Transcript_7294/g.17786  ORF Transcript_7294/g.17786 Transcript_7294/m.17786 type:complete len:550 (-) Transcript_7294:179-1828(-)
MGCCASSEDENMGCKNSKGVEQEGEGGIHEQLMKTNKSGGIWHEYQRGRLLGAGMTGAVHIATHRKSGKKYAIKSINKRKLDPAQLGELKNEVELLRQLDHPNIVRLYEVYEHGNKMYLVMQLLLGKDLGKVNFTNERQVAIVMKKIVNAIAYCHSQGICHRDIKLENFVFTSKENLEDIIVIDFGIGKRTVDVSDSIKPKKKVIKESKGEQKRNMQTICGTPYYMSPQVLDGRYDEKCDCWALGVLAYILLVSKPPFNGKYKSELDSAIRMGVVQYPRGMSPPAREFIANLLKVDPTKRWSCAEALKSHWFKLIEKKDTKKMELEKDTLERMITFQQSGKLKKLVLMVRAFRDQSKKVEALKDTFDSLDSENTGAITEEELKLAFERHDIKLDTKEIFGSLDVDKKGEISYTEFIAATYNDDLEGDRELLRSLFDSLDFTNNGKITSQDLQHLLGRDARNFNIKELLKEGDISGTGEITYEDFVQLMSQPSQFEIRTAVGSTVTIPETRNGLKVTSTTAALSTTEREEAKQKEEGKKENPDSEGGKEN